MGHGGNNVIPNVHFRASTKKTQRFSLFFVLTVFDKETDWEVSMLIKKQERSVEPPVSISHSPSILQNTKNVAGEPRRNCLDVLYDCITTKFSHHKIMHHKIDKV